MIRSLGLAVLLAAAPAAAQDKGAREAVGGVLGRFFAELEKADAARAADAISLEFRLDDAARKRFRSGLESLLGTAGAAESWHLLALDDVPPAGRLYTALVVSHHAKRPVAWTFAFYRLADGAWSLLDVRYDSDDVPGFVRRGTKG